MSMPRFLLVFFLITPMLLFAFLSIWQRNGMIQLGYETQTLQNDRTDLLRQRKDLFAEISRLSSIERIEQLALEEIQMKNATPEQRVYVSLKSQEQ